MFDTHCHLNFEAFNDSYDEVIKQAHMDGISHILIPGTDMNSSGKAVEIASKYDDIYAAVGIHPHHVFETTKSKFPISNQISDVKSQMEQLLENRKVVAIGEVGMDRHIYSQTKYEEYAIDESFISSQKELLKFQIQLAIEYKKSLILHNREAKDDILPLLNEVWDESLRGRSVFHCCEADHELLSYIKYHGMYLGIDGDISWSKKKQLFIKEVPLNLLVLETDSPFLTPEPIRRENPQNNPSNLRIICQTVAEIKGETFETVASVTEENGRKLFGI